MIQDGRIHPGRIEELVARAQADVEASILEAGEQAVLDACVTGLHPELIRLIGRMRYRFSYGQNLLAHSVEVSRIGAMLASELGADVCLVRRACLLHDLGKVVPDAEGPHALEIHTRRLENWRSSPARFRAWNAPMPCRQGGRCD